MSHSWSALHAHLLSNTARTSFEARYARICAAYGDTLPAGGVPGLARRVGASLAFGFLSVFGFAVLAQAAVDFLNNVLGVPMKFLLPFGLAGAHLTPGVLADVAGGLTTVSLLVSALFFGLIQRHARLRERRFWRKDGD